MKKNDNPNTLTILIFFFISALLAAFFAAATNDTVFEILKGYQGLLAGLGAITAALIAYKAATEKLNLDKQHKADDERRHFLARNLHAVRVARFIVYRLEGLIVSLNEGDNLTLGQLRVLCKTYFTGPSGGLVECLNNAAELDLKIVVQLHRLYSTLEMCNRMVAALNEYGNESSIVRDKEYWLLGNAHSLEVSLRHAYDLCRVIITLGREAVGSEHILTSEEFSIARDKAQGIEDLPLTRPLQSKAK